jgi:hypothetical protein
MTFNRLIQILPPALSNTGKILNSPSSTFLTEVTSVLNKCVLVSLYLLSRFFPFNADKTLSISDKRAYVLEHGLIGETNGQLYVSCPLHKRNFSLDTGDCKNDDEYKILAFDVKEENGDLLVQLPPSDELDALIGSSRWMVRKAKSAAASASPSNELE